MRRPCRTCSKDWPLGAGSCTEPSFSFKSTFSFSSSTSSTFEAEPEPKTEAGEGRVDDPPPRASARERRDSGDGSTSVDGAELEFVGDVVELLFVGGSEFVVRANSVRKGCVGVEKIEDGDGDGDGGGEERDEERGWGSELGDGEVSCRGTQWIVWPSARPWIDEIRSTSDRAWGREGDEEGEEATDGGLEEDDDDEVVRSLPLYISL